jgi:hypothetical protein
MADISTPLKHFSDAVLSNEAMARKRDLGELTLTKVNGPPFQELETWTS